MPEVLVIPAEVAELARVYDWVEGLGERLALSPKTLFAMQLCLEEALTNTILHGFAEGVEDAERGKGVRLTFRPEDDAIVVTIEDHGVAFDPLEASAPAAPASVDEASIGGLGIHLIRQYTRHLTYERRDGANHLTLSFAYP